MIASEVAPGSAGARRTVVWAPLWNSKRVGQGLEHLLLRADAADSILLGFDEADRPYRLMYQLQWDPAWSLRTAQLVVTTEQAVRTLQFTTNGAGRWWDAAGQSLPSLQGCYDLDLWPTPFTNTLALRRLALALHERQEIDVVYVAAPALTVTVMRQAYTRLAERLYRYESVERGYHVALPVDAAGVVLDYPGLFRRLQ